MPFAIVLDAGHDIPRLFGEIRHAVDAIDDVSERIASCCNLRWQNCLAQRQNHEMRGRTGDSFLVCLQVFPPFPVISTVQPDRLIGLSVPRPFGLINLREQRDASSCF